MTKKLASISLNLDSIRECLKLAGIETPPAGFRDPAYFDIMDRLLAIADRFGAKLTIFVIGQDLEDRDAAREVRRWANMGHEIGNHSLSHHQHMAEMPAAELREEVARAHDVIASVVGVAPRGFVAPAWSYAPALPEILASLGYRYDTSLFPSFFMPLIQLRLRWRSRVAAGRIPLLRKDLAGSLYGSRQPFYATVSDPWRSRATSGDVIMLPLPTTRLRFPVWHTVAFMLSPRRFRSVLGRAIDSSRAFYYLMHPTDLVDPDTDLEGLPPTIRSIERMGVPLREKTRLLEASLSTVAERCSFVTMSELADAARRDLARTAH